MAQVTYTLDLVPENAGKIDAINQILFGAGYKAEAPKEPVVKETPAKETKSTEEKISSAISAAEFKEAAKAVKKDHGEEFALAVLKEQGVEVNSTLGRSIGKVDEELYSEIMACWESGPVTEQADDEPVDDLDDDLEDDLEEDDSEVDVDAVKAACKAYSKENGRDKALELMSKHGAKALADVGKLESAKLKALFKALTA